MDHPRWDMANGRSLTLDQPRIMAILNVTPDSFSDGGRLGTPELALEAALRAVDEGADMLDIGGESTRPGASRVEPDEQIRRVVPVIEAIRGAGIGVPISVDTTRASVARAALDAGADAINDVSAGAEDDAMLALAALRSCGLVLMHRLTSPERDSYSDRYSSRPEYSDVVKSVLARLRERMEAATGEGISPVFVCLDPGLGFGKSVEQNIELIERSDELLTLGRPLLSALSRKSFVGRASLGRDSDPDERLSGTLALSVCHLARGVRLFRVHDVGAHREALGAAWSVMKAM